MNLVIMETAAAAQLVRAYVGASAEVAWRAAAVARLASNHEVASGLLGPVVAQLRVLATELAADAADVEWRRRWLLERDAVPDDAAIDAAMDGNICRCGMYGRIRKAIRSVAGVAHFDPATEGVQHG